MTDSLPTPAERRTIAVVSHDDYQRIKEDHRRIDLLETPGALVVPLPAAGKPMTAVQRFLLEKNLLIANSVLVQSPYSTDRYVSLDSAIRDMTVEKYAIFTELCQLLGARTVEVKDERRSSRAKKRSWIAKFKRSGVKATAIVDQSVTAQVTNSIIHLHRFKGDKPNIAAARELLRRHHLDTDPTLSSLIKIRAGKNAVQEQQVELQSTAEINHSLKIGLELNSGLTGKALMAISGDYTKTVQTKEDVVIRTTVRF